MKYEDILDEKAENVFSMNLSELNEYRIDLKLWLKRTESLKSAEKLTRGKIVYLGGLINHVIRPLLRITKERQKTLNRVANNGANADLQREFVRIAMDILPLWQFQQIYGKAVANCKYKTNIVDIEDFMIDCVRLNQDKNGNVK